MTWAVPWPTERERDSDRSDLYGMCVCVFAQVYVDWVCFFQANKFAVLKGIQNIWPYLLFQ